MIYKDSITVIKIVDIIEMIYIDVKIINITEMINFLQNNKCHKLLNVTKY